MDVSIYVQYTYKVSNVPVTWFIDIYKLPLVTIFMSFHHCDTVIEHILNLDITIDITHLQSIRSKKLSSYICKYEENSHCLNVER